MMKGVIDVEFVLSILVFVLVISFVSVLIISNLPLLHSDAVRNDLRSRAYQAAYQLTFYSGLNADGSSTAWSAEDVSQLGLASSRYELSPAKISELAELCASSYERFRDLMAQDFRRVIIVNVSSPAASAFCGPGAITTVSQEFQSTRFALAGGSVARVTVSVI